MPSTTLQGQALWNWGACPCFVTIRKGKSGHKVMLWHKLDLCHTRWVWVNRECGSALWIRCWHVQSKHFRSLQALLCLFYPGSVLPKPSAASTTPQQSAIPHPELSGTLVPKTTQLSELATLLTHLLLEILQHERLLDAIQQGFLNHLIIIKLSDLTS